MKEHELAIKLLEDALKRRQEHFDYCRRQVRRLHDMIAWDKEHRTGGVDPALQKELETLEPELKPTGFEIQNLANTIETLKELQ